MKYLTCLSMVLVMLACGSSKKNEKAELRRVFNSAHNELIWMGSKIGGKEHTGNIKFKSVDLKHDGEALVGGEIIVDLVTLRCTDLEGEWQIKLENHLLNEDFFDVAKYPVAKLELKEVNKTDELNLLEVVGLFTIKGQTHEEKFRINMLHHDGKVIYNAMLSLDRTKYGVMYGSSNFIKGLGDKAISDMFMLEVQLVVDLEEKVS